MPIYSEFDPPPTVDAFVHCIWRYTQDEPTGPDIIVPDGRPELIIHLAQPYFEAETGLQQPYALFAGQLTKPLKIEAKGPASIWGVRFKPDGAQPFLKMSVAETTDRRVALSDIIQPSAEPLREDLHASSSHEQALAILSAFVGSRLGDARPDPIVRALIEGPYTQVSDVPEISVRPRQVQRRFKRATGTSLRMYRAIRRFRSVFDRLRDIENESWVERALETGYFDQPQLARDFQRFLGCSARTWVHENHGLGQALSKNPG